MTVFELTPEELLGPLSETEKKHAPGKLFVSGDTGVFTSGPSVSVVGSSSPAGLARASKLSA